MKKLLLLCVVLSLWMFGCGSDKDTSGTLILSDITSTDLSGGTFKVDATATFAPDAGKEATGAEINFTAVFTTPSNATPVTRTSKYTLNKAGIASYTDMVVQSNEPAYLRLTASIGGLSQTKFVTIPLFDSTLRTTPSIITFSQVDPAGGQAPVSVALSGGFLPYTIVSNDKLLDIEAKFAGSTSLTISKLAASGTNSISSFATITLQDSKGTPATLRVNYFK
jgi:hypothetical protein